MTTKTADLNPNKVKKMSGLEEQHQTNSNHIMLC